MRDHQHRAGKLEQRIFKRPQGFDVQIVGRLIEQQHVAALEQRLGQMQTTAFTTGQTANLLLLILALEVEPSEVSPRWHFEAADIDDVQTLGDFFPDVVRAFQRFAGLLDIGHLDGLADDDFTAVGLLLAGNHPEQRRFTGTVGADDADDGTGGHDETEIIDQHPVAVALGDVLELEHRIAQPLSHRNEDFLGFVALLVVVGAELFKALQTRLALGLAPLRVLTHPLQLLADGPLTSRFARLFGLESVFFLIEPVGVIALVRNTLTAIEFENPLGRVVEEVAIVRDRNDRTGELGQKHLQPFDAFGIKVVGGLVEQQHIGARQQQAAQGHPTLFTT